NFRELAQALAGLLRNREIKASLRKAEDALGLAVDALNARVQKLEQARADLLAGARPYPVDLDAANGFVHRMARKWLDKAEKDYKAMRILQNANNEELSSVVAFHAQQCVEKLLKGLMVLHGKWV